VTSYKWRNVRILESENTDFSKTLWGSYFKVLSISYFWTVNEYEKEEHISLVEGLSHTLSHLLILPCANQSIRSHGNWLRLSGTFSRSEKHTFVDTDRKIKAYHLNVSIALFHNKQLKWHLFHLSFPAWDLWFATWEHFLVVLLETAGEIETLFAL